MRGIMAELVEDGLDPSGGQFGVLGMQMMGEAPEVLAAVVEVEGFGRPGEAILDQVPYPESSIGYDKNLPWPVPAQCAWLGLGSWRRDQ
jgi:hypothetical protein